MKTGRSSGKCRISESFMGVLIWNSVQKSGLMGSGLIWDCIVQQCLRSLGSYKMRIGETAEAAEYLELFRNEDPYSEDIAAMLITAYGRLGDYKNANRVYREYEDLYLREFEEKPGPEVRKAFEGCRKKW